MANTLVFIFLFEAMHSSTLRLPYSNGTHPQIGNEELAFDFNSDCHSADISLRILSITHLGQTESVKLAANHDCISIANIALFQDTAIIFKMSDLMTTIRNVQPSITPLVEIATIEIKIEDLTDEKVFTSDCLHINYHSLETPLLAPAKAQTEQ